MHVSVKTGDVLKLKPFRQGMEKRNQGRNVRGRRNGMWPFQLDIGRGAVMSIVGRVADAEKAKK